jgi:hypothetical protein
MTGATKRAWIRPEVRKYGSFESATLYCDKRLGEADGFTYVGQAIVCAS